jgi:hypothetical protein
LFKCSSAACNTFNRTSRSWFSSRFSFTPSRRTNHGSVSPCNTSVDRITQKLKKMIRSRPGNGRPSANVSGSASAAASDTTPRIPLQLMIAIACHGGMGSRWRRFLLNHRGIHVAGKTHNGRTTITTALTTTP